MINRRGDLHVVLVLDILKLRGEARWSRVIRDGRGWSGRQATILQAIEDRPAFGSDRTEAVVSRRPAPPQTGERLAELTHVPLLSGIDEWHQN
jgi:hypothetical protein